MELLEIVYLVSSHRKDEPLALPNVLRQNEVGLLGQRTNIAEKYSENVSDCFVKILSSCKLISAYIKMLCR